MLRPFFRSGLRFRFKNAPLISMQSPSEDELASFRYFCLLWKPALFADQGRVKEPVDDFWEKHRKIFTSKKRHSEQMLSYQGLFLISANHFDWQPLIACTGRIKRPGLKVDLPLGGVGNEWVSQLVLCPLSSCKPSYSRLSFGKTEVNYFSEKIPKML